ncbi:Glycosyl transferase family, a/b domain [Loktanella fryxellensis]|uniref:Glycosyl transferase family, a/b domain n=2 Tax=Loktanella fryxellensis TaxID=245187 RepID=A0A1H8IPI8_9RHOB|nr:Glycosyl transferase family, a/b domain [Loktanella fryxellensis]
MFQNDSKFRKPDGKQAGVPSTTDIRVNGAAKTADDLPSAPLARLRLIAALDALLSAGSVSGAARMLDMSAPAMSRLLAQLRQQFDDDILVRSGRLMVPTPRAVALRAQARRISRAADALMQGEDDTGWHTTAQRPDAVPVPNPPPLLTQTTWRDTPNGTDRDARTTDAQARLARLVAVAGGGPGRARTLRMAEAQEAFGTVLRGEADPVQIGALLVALQSRGMTAEELAGCVKASREGRDVSLPMRADLDWPAYVSPRNSRLPYFLLAARALADAGHRIALHGYAQAISQFGTVLDTLHIPVAGSRAAAAAHLASARIAFLPLPAIDPQLQAMTGLYPLLDMRSAINAVIPLLNPMAAPISVVAVASPGAARLCLATAAMLDGQLCCVTGHRDVVQATPHLAMSIHRSAALRDSDIYVASDPMRVRPRMPPGYNTREFAASLWSGDLKDANAEAIVCDTIACGLLALSDSHMGFVQARDEARDVWLRRGWGGA